MPKKGLCFSSQLRRELDFHILVPQPRPRPEAVQRIVQGDALEACADDLFDQLPHNLKQADPVEVPRVPLGYHYDDREQHSGWDFSRVPNVLYQSH